MGKRKLFDYDDNESDDDICVNSRPSKISCFEKGCYSAENGGDYVNVKSGYSDDDEAAAEDKVDSVSFVEKFSCDKVDGVSFVEKFSCDKVDGVEEERMDEKKRGYVNDDSTDDDHEGFFVEEESCGSCEEKGGDVARDEIVDEEFCYEKSCNVNSELSENKGRYWDICTDDDKGVFVEKECSSREEKGDNVTGDEKECCYEKTYNVNGELSEDKGRYWDTWSGKWTNDKAIYDCEGWFIGWRE
nr:hypothetical protein [Tanacetum cinerariifolium]